MDSLRTALLALSILWPSNMSRAFRHATANGSTMFLLAVPVGNQLVEGNLFEPVTVGHSVYNEEDIHEFLHQVTIAHRIIDRLHGATPIMPELMEKGSELMEKGPELMKEGEYKGYWVIDTSEGAFEVVNKSGNQVPGSIVYKSRETAKEFIDFILS